MLSALIAILANNSPQAAIDTVKPNSISWDFLKEQSVQLLHTFMQLLPTLFLGIIILVVSYLIATPLSRLLIKPITYMTNSKLVHLVARRGISTLIILLGFLPIFTLGWTD